MDDFIIENGVLKKYQGPGGDVIVPEGVTKIGCVAFSGCETLKSVVLPAGVTEIEGGCFSGAFSGCEKLKSVSLPEGLTKLGSFAFFGCKSLRTLTLPESLAEIGAEVFERSGLTSLTLPAGVKTVGNEAFRRCRKLKRVVVLGAPKFGKDVFRDASPLLLFARTPLTAIKSVNMKRQAVLGWILREADDPPVEEAAAESFRKYWDKSMEFFLDDVLTDERLLPALLEQGLLSLEQTDVLLERFAGSAEAVAGLLQYRERFFSAAAVEKHEEKKLEKALKAPTVAELKKAWATKELSDGSLELVTYKGADTEVVIPDRIGKKPVSLIGSECLGIADWYGENYRSVENNDVRKKITSVSIPEGIRKIDLLAFFGCACLTRVELPASVKTVWMWAFKNCGALTDFSAAEGLETLGSEVFRDCAALRRVRLPASLREIGPGAFDGCGSVTIFAPEGSYAEQYARENGIPFQAE